MSTEIEQLRARVAELEAIIVEAGEQEAVAYLEGNPDGLWFVAYSINSAAPQKPLYTHPDYASAARIRELEAEVERLKSVLQPPERHALQVEGKHPSPCARFCEAQAFLIDERRHKRRIADLEQRNAELLDIMKHAADQIRKCDYTPARSTLLAAIEAIAKGGV